MRQFDDVELWRVSAFKRLRRNATNSTEAYAGLDGLSTLSTGLTCEFNNLRQLSLHDDALEIFSACLRHLESTLIYLQCGDFVWPVTIFPAQRLFHSPRDLSEVAFSVMGDIRFLRAEPPGVRPFGHRDLERVMPANQYRPIGPLLRTLAFHGPRKTLLSAIAHKTKFKLHAGAMVTTLGLTGAIGSAARRMRREPASFAQVASWPGMNAERASRLLNAMYLSSGLVLSGQSDSGPLRVGQRFLDWALRLRT